MPGATRAIGRSMSCAAAPASAQSRSPLRLPKRARWSARLLRWSSFTSAWAASAPRPTPP